MCYVIFYNGIQFRNPQSFKYCDSLKPPKYEEIAGLQRKKLKDYPFCFFLLLSLSLFLSPFTTLLIHLFAVRLPTGFKVHSTHSPRCWLRTRARRPPHTHPALLRPIFSMIKSFNLLLEFWRCALFWLSCNFRISRWRFLSFFPPPKGTRCEILLKALPQCRRKNDKAKWEMCLVIANDLCAACGVACCINFHFYGS